MPVHRDFSCQVGHSTLRVSPPDHASNQACLCKQATQAGRHHQHLGWAVVLHISMYTTRIPKREHALSQAQSTRSHIVSHKHALSQARSTQSYGL